MNKKVKVTILIVLGAGLILFTLRPTLNNVNIQVSNSTQTLLPTVPADKIEVIHFHGTQQCWSCITVGEYALETIKEKFREDYESGKIVFKDVNGELKENQAIVIKYQARGSSLFVNSTVGEKESIKEDTNVWRLVNNESQFKTYFENKLKGLLGQ